MLQITQARTTTTRSRLPPIEVAKCESLLNDFCVVEDAPGTRWTGARARSICHRRTGIGADGLIILKSLEPNTFEFRLFNADGSGAEWSGNGVRCAAAYLQQQKQLPSAILHTKAGQIDVCMRTARAGRTAVSFDRPAPSVSVMRETVKSSALPGSGIPLYVDAGNPHLVFITLHFNFNWEMVGAKCQAAASKTHGVNVEFVVLQNRRCFDMRIFERGVGPTPSSGSGALAAFAACRHRDLVDASVQAESPGGVQRLKFNRREDSVTLTALSRVVSMATWYGN